MKKDADWIKGAPSLIRNNDGWLKKLVFCIPEDFCTLQGSHQAIEKGVTGLVVRLILGYMMPAAKTQTSSF